MERANQKSTKIGEYLLIFVTILLSFSAYEYIKIFALILKARSYENLIQPQFFVLLTFFLILVEYWWNSFNEIFSISRNISWFFLVLLQPVIFYLVATLLTPEFTELSNFSERFYSNFFENRIQIYILGIILIIVFTKLSEQKFMSLLNLFRLIYLICCILGIIFAAETIQYILSISMLGLTFIFIVKLSWKFFD
ncbi:MAG: hypothetical protein HOO86_09015 [Bacteroidales bacterium]|nr:hypothetical protein [Bacteroidales bacterium]